MLTRRIILHTTAYFIAVSLTVMVDLPFGRPNRFNPELLSGLPGTIRISDRRFPPPATAEVMSNCFIVL